MKLVRQIKLFLQEGSSDKVYEIDLCETPQGEYLVNFRYGRRGANLKDGTKTVFPVSFLEAERIFAELENEKRKKGYASVGEVAIQEDFVRESPKKGEKGRKAIVRYLKQAVGGEEHETWPTSRIIWRAGELKIIEAEPMILNLIEDESNTYSAVWALARLGSLKAMPILEKIKSNATLASYISQLAIDALLSVGTGEVKDKIYKEEAALLPQQLRQLFDQRDWEALGGAIHEFLNDLKTTSNRYLVALYRLSRCEPNLKELLISSLRAVVIQAGAFKYLRQIFKISEMVDDFDMYGVLARKFESHHPGYRSTGYGWVFNGTSYVDPKKEFQTANPSLAFSNKTKDYFLKRTLRRLRERATEENEYTRFATSILLGYQDEFDRKEPFVEHKYEYVTPAQGRGRYEYVTIHFDSYATCAALNQILYGKSPRYQRYALQKWKCVGKYVPGAEVAPQREELYSRLWDQDAASVIRLLSESKTEAVLDFAFKIFEANEAFVKDITVSHVMKFLSSPLGKLQVLGTDLASKLYNQALPQVDLVLALVDCNYLPAREMAFRWVQERNDVFSQDLDFMTALVLSSKEETRQWARNWLGMQTLPVQVKEALFEKVLVFILHDSHFQKDELWAAALADTLVVIFHDLLPKLSVELLLKLILHEKVALQLIGAKLLIKNTTDVSLLPEALLTGLVSSEKDMIRAVGIELMGRLPYEQLKLKKNLLISLLVSPLADVRNNVKPVLEDLVSRDAAFAKELTELLIPSLLMPENYEGVHGDVVSFFTRPAVILQLKSLDKRRILSLAKSKNIHVRLLSVRLLMQNVPYEQLEVSELVKMADHPILEGRQYAWKGFEAQIDKVKAEKEEAVKVVDTYWDDTREFAFAYFKKHFHASDWTPSLFVGLCDSVKPSVQAYGREMIQRCFDSEDGAFYLLSLSQHPVSEMQAFASAYLEDYATGRPDLIIQLEQYFVTLLSQVNKGRTAKERALEFLRKEAKGSREVAGFVAKILNRVSTTMSVIDKAKCIEILLGIKSMYPDISTVVNVQSLRSYSSIES